MEDTSGENKPVQPKPEGQVINLVVKDQLGTEVHFKVKSHTKLEKVFKAYCDKKSMDPKAVKFLFDGARVHGYNTPVELDMEDSDVLDCMVEQTGGCCCC